MDIFESQEANPLLNLIYQQIRERRPELTYGNFVEKTSDLTKWALEELDLDESDFIQRREIFKTYYDEYVFPYIGHIALEELPLASNGTVALKSPTLLGKARQSGEVDKIIGNQDFVFGCFFQLRSRGGRGRNNTYLIDPTSQEEAYVVSSDHADLHPKSIAPIALQTPDEVEKFTYEMYRDNMFTLENFKDFFSAYCACFFEQPDDAITFFMRSDISNLPQRADSWSDREMSLLDEPIASKLIQMRELFRSSGIIPPIAPEVMFKNSVQATPLDTKVLVALEDQFTNNNDML